MSPCSQLKTLHQEAAQLRQELQRSFDNGLKAWDFGEALDLQKAVETKLKSLESLIALMSGPFGDIIFEFLPEIMKLRTLAWDQLKKILVAHSGDLDEGQAILAVRLLASAKSLNLLPDKAIALFRAQLMAKGNVLYKSLTKYSDPKIGALGDLLAAEILANLELLEMLGQVTSKFFKQRLAMKTPALIASLIRDIHGSDNEFTLARAVRNFANCQTVDSISETQLKGTMKDLIGKKDKVRNYLRWELSPLEPQDTLPALWTIAALKRLPEYRQ